MANTKIGIIGNGNVGTALERGLTHAGYEVQTTGKDAERVSELGNWADIVILAVPYGQRRNAVKELGDSVDGKPLVDVTNALGADMEYAGNLELSGAEEVQKLAKSAYVVKAFNTVFAQHMDSGMVEGEPLSIFVAADEAAAKQSVIDLANAIGFDAVDAGPLEHSRWLEPLGYLNIALASKADHGKNVGFRFIHPTQKTPTRGSRPQPTAERADRTPTRTATTRRAKV